jgi:hypothetical protein
MSGDNDKMPRKRIAITDLLWIFEESLRGQSNCPLCPTIAIVPAPGSGWQVVVGKRLERSSPKCVKLIRALETKLRQEYMLKSEDW